MTKLTLSDSNGVQVKKVATSIAETIADIHYNLKLAESHPELFAAAGLYPANLDLEEAERIGALIEKNVEKLVAIGEVGLDYWVVKEEEGRELQREIFRTFIDLSLETDLPLNIHSRSAGKIVIQMLLEKGAQAVHLHAGRAAADVPVREDPYPAVDVQVHRGEAPVHERIPPTEHPGARVPGHAARSGAHCRHARRSPARAGVRPADGRGPRKCPERG